MFVLIVVLTVLAVFASGQSADQEKRRRLVFVACIVIASALVAGFVGGGLRGRRWASYRLQVGDDDVLRVGEGLEPMRLNRGEITKVEEIKGSGLFLRTEARLRVLFIPVDLAGYHEVRDIISQWQTPRALTAFARASRASPQLALGLLCFASWFACKHSGSLAVVVPSALLFYGLLVLGFLELQRNPNIPKSQKMWYWFLLLPLWNFLALPFLTMCSIFGK